MPPRNAVVEKRGWITKWKVMTFVEYRGYDYKAMKTQKNYEQGFLKETQLCNIQYGSYKEVQNWREKEAKAEKAEKVKCSSCGGKDTVV